MHYLTCWNTERLSSLYPGKVYRCSDLILGRNLKPCGNVTHLTPVWGAVLTSIWPFLCSLMHYVPPVPQPWLGITVDQLLLTMPTNGDEGIYEIYYIQFWRITTAHTSSGFQTVILEVQEESLHQWFTNFFRLPLPCLSVTSLEPSSPFF